MDRPVSKRDKRKMLIKQLRVIIPIVLIPVLIIILAKTVLTPSINLDRVSTGTADLGSLQITVQGSGVVIPNYEEVINAPFRSQVLKIVKNPGDAVEPGDTLLILNNELASNELDKLINEKQLLIIRKQKTTIELQQLIDDYTINKKIREIRIANLKFSLEAEEYLYKIGGSTMDIIRKARTELQIAELEYEQSTNLHNNQVNAKKSSIEETEFEIKIKENDIVEARNKVDLAYVKAPIKGNLSWMLNQAGASISEGERVAVVADLSKYRLKGTISNSWAGKIMVNQPVLIRDRDRIFNGTIDNILPSVSEGMMECQIRMDDGDLGNLRPNQQLEIRVVISFKQESIRLPNGPYYTSKGNKDLYVIKGNKAILTKVLLGEANFDYVEVLSGLQPGDQVIITDLGNKYDREEIKIK